MPLETWLTFLVASFLISLSPGAGAIACMAAGVRFGFARAVWNVLGLIAGLQGVLALVATGLGALLAASTIAFTIVKWLGVAYLVWLGVAQWRAPVESAPTLAAFAASLPPEGADSRLGTARRRERIVDAEAVGKELCGTRGQLFWRGVLVNATNPKAIVFMLAVLPQFIDPARPLLVQYAACGATLGFTDSIVMSGYTAFAAKALRLLRKRRQIRAMNKTFGGLLMAMGALLAMFKRTP